MVQNLTNRLLTFALLFSLILISGCNSKTKTSASIYVFGTLVDIHIYNTPSTQAEKAITEVEQTFRNFHQEWHAWEKGGIVSKINHAISQEQAIRVAPSVKNFILKSQKLNLQSQGLFDPGIGGLIQLWGFHSEQWQGPPPTEIAIQQWLKSAPSIKDIKFDGLHLTSTNPQVQLDFGGNAKGLAMDIATQVLVNNQIKSALISIGGDIKVIGLKEPSKPTELWNIGIQSPSEPEKALVEIKIQAGESIVTSGDYQRFFEWQGQTFSHIINPKTGYPANTFRSVTVIDTDATKADAAATALMIAGPTHWQSIAASMKVDKVLCIDHNGHIFQTPQMRNRASLL